LKGIQKITLLLLAITILVACGRKKNTFLNRNAHAVTAEYNTLYNGNVAYEKGKDELSLSFRDNFWEILPIERIQPPEEAILPGESKSPDFNRAEEKSIKAIQKHAIYIDGKEHNPQIDEAYMLLGKSRYYDSRFIPALDAFNFILDKYPTSNNINNAKVWKAKTNIRLNNEDYALENLHKMFKAEDLEGDELADASAMMAQAYINLDSIEEAVPYIKLAASNIRNKELKGRYTYIKGQLYNHLEQKDSANMAFDEVIDLNRKSPRVYMINSYLEKAKNFDYKKEDRVALLELLQDLEENRENRPFLDKIYYQIGEFYRNSDSIETAITYYNKSIQNYKDDKILQAFNYQTLAEINFDRSEYKRAGSYYDSTLTNLEENSRQWRRIKKKRDNLADVIKYEDIAALNDSILRIANMSESDQVAFFTDYTNKLKAQAIEDSIARVKVEEGIANNEFYKKAKKESGNETSGKFYFYNSSTVSYGKQEFRKIWGDRKLEDNWRLSSKRSKLEEISDVEANENPIAKSEVFNLETYLERIPKDEKVIDSLTNERNFAYYQLGLIYMEKFKENELAVNRFEKLLSYNPEERLVLPTKYNLYKIYEEMGNTELAARYKNDILNNYADSRYAEILLNPNSTLATDQSSPEFKYKQLYKDFEASKYQQVIDTCEEYINSYNGDDIIPKLELLKATAIGRQQGYEAYKKALNFVSLTYANTDEGKQAQQIYTTVLPNLAKKDFENDEAATHYKMVYQFPAADDQAAIDLQEKLDKAITFYRYTNLSTSIDYYSPELAFVIVHGFNTKGGARQFGDVLRENKDYKIVKDHFEISSANYRTIQIHKNLSDYPANGVIE
jgi:tetratricopeptide (TPR) repeat protein